MKKINFSNSENIEPIKSIEISMSNHKQNFENELILIFNQLKNQVMNYNNPELIKYYQTFFEHFTTEMLLNNCVINNGFSGKKIIDQFHNVFNLNQFKDYLQSIPGLYPKLVLWSINNPFPKISGSIQIKHHAMPRFLIKHYGFKKHEIEVEYNLVKISWSFHFFWHLVRFIEYNQIQDFVALSFMLQNRTRLNNKRASSNQNNLSTNELLINKLLHSFLDNNFIPNVLMNLQFEKQLSTFLASHRMSDNTKQILTTTTKWRHKNDYSKKERECFELIFNPQNNENCSIKNFSIDFINKVNTFYIQTFNKPFLLDHKNQEVVLQDKILESIVARLSLYFRGYTGSVSDFYIVNPPNFIKPIAVVGNRKYIENRKIQRDPEQEDILNKIRFTITHKDPKVPIIYGEPGQFKSIYDITVKCCQLEYKYLNIGNSENITANKRSNHRLSYYFKRILILDNPIRKRKRRSITGLTRNKPRMKHHHCRGWTANKLR